MQSLSRALTVLEELARQDSPRTLTQLTAAVGLHKSTVHRMLATFVRHGVVRRDEANRYQIGGGIFGLTWAAAGETDPWAVLDELGGTLACSTGAHVAYAVARSGQLERAISYTPEGERFALTHPLPWHASAAAKAYLAWRPRAEVQRIVSRSPLERFTDHTMTDPFLLMQALNRAKVRGYAVEDREQDLRIRALGAPVLDRAGAATAALELQVPPDVADPAELQHLAERLSTTAQHLTERMARSGADAPMAPVELTEARA